MILESILGLLKPSIYRIIVLLLMAIAAGGVIKRFVDWIRKPKIKTEISGKKHLKVTVKNETGKEIHIAPRNFEIVEGKSPNVEFVAPLELSSYLSGGREVEVQDSLPGGSLYCQFPSSTDPLTGRGPWATKLEAEGLDSEKMMTTKPLPHYEAIMENVIAKFRKEDTHSFKKKAKKFKEKTGLKLEPDDLLPELVNEDSKEGKVELRGADKELRFIKINGEWEKYRVFHEFTRKLKSLIPLT